MIVLNPAKRKVAYEN